MQKGRYLIPNHPDKVVFSQSWIMDFYTCPMKFGLAYTNDMVFDSKAIRHGNLFERLVLGDFDGKLSEYQYRKGSITGEEVQTCANVLLDRCINFDRDSAQIRIVQDLGEYGLGGVIDFLGKFLDNVYCINDLKYSDNAMRSAFYNPTKEEMTIKDVLQALVYSYLVYLKLGKILPFRRIVVTPVGTSAAVWVTQFTANLESFRYLEAELARIYQAFKTSLLPATDNTSFCYNKADGACKMMQYCSHGMNHFFGKQTIEINKVLNIEELAY